MGGIDRSESLAELNASLATFQAEMPAVPKTSVNPFYNSKYADLADVVKASAPVAAKHGLSVLQLPGYNDRGPTLWTYLCHASGQFIGTEAELHAAKDDPQGIGSALSYMRRYAYCAVLGVVADEDDDGNASVPNEYSPPTPRASSTKDASDKQVGLIKHLFEEQGYSQDERKGLVLATTGREVKSLGELTSAEASKLLDDLKKDGA